MTTRLDYLELRARSLDPDADSRAELTRQAFDYAQNYLDSIASAPAYSDKFVSEDSLIRADFSEEGIGLERVLGMLEKDVDTVGINTTSGRFVGYIPGGGLFHSAIGDFLAAVGNRYAGVAFASPGATRIEDQCLRWIADLVGYPNSFGGYLSAGGSLANFTAIVAARDAHDVEGEHISRSVVYLTEHAHHCVDKALHLSGLGKCPVRRIAVDERYRMDVDALENQLRADVEKGLTPFLIVATAGTTNTGSVDPLTPIGKLATRFSAWYHIDAAYGGLFALCEETSDLFEGMRLSDSIVVDPHKTLFLPYGTGALLVRDKQHLLTSHAAGADYMQDAIHIRATSAATVSPELTKHFRGLRMWLPLQVLGIAPFRAGLAEKLHLARYFYDRVAELPNWEVGPVPDLSVVIYRYVPTGSDADSFNEKLVEAVHRDGRIFVSSTRINGVYMLRMAAVCFRTHKKDIDDIIDVLTELASRIETT